jgi:hypothetical protein
MAKRRAHKPLFSSAPVLFRDSKIAGRGVFARRPFKPGDVVVPYAPKQRRFDLHDPEAVAAAETRLTLLSERSFVIVPDTSVPGGWLCNHSCNPNAAIFSDGEGRIQCIRAILPGDEVTIFYGWVTENAAGRDPCLCNSPNCKGFINFDLTDSDAAALGGDSAARAELDARIRTYGDFLAEIGQEHVLRTIVETLERMERRKRSAE